MLSLQTLQIISRTTDVPLPLDVWGTISSFADRTTLTQTLSLVSKGLLRVSRPYLVQTIELTTMGMIEYHLLRLEAERASVEFSLPLNQTKDLRVLFRRITRREVLVLCHFVKAAHMHPAKFAIHGNLYMSEAERQYVYTTFLLPLQEIFDQVRELRVSSRDILADDESLMWLSLCRQAAVITSAGTPPTTFPSKARGRQQPPFHPVPMDNLAHVVSENKLKQRPAKQVLAGCTFIPDTVIITADGGERMLEAMRFWKQQCMTLNVKTLRIHTCYWSMFNGAHLLYYGIQSCDATLVELQIDHIAFRGTCCLFKRIATCISTSGKVERSTSTSGEKSDVASARMMPWGPVFQFQPTLRLPALKSLKISWNSLGSLKYLVQMVGDQGITLTCDCRVNPGEERGRKMPSGSVVNGAVNALRALRHGEIELLVHPELADQWIVFIQNKIRPLAEGVSCRPITIE